jgi:hypothetical protein
MQEAQEIFSMPGKPVEKKMDIEHPTSNIERRMKKQRLTLGILGTLAHFRHFSGLSGLGIQ